MPFNRLSNTFFFTATNLNWQPALENEERKKLMIETLRFLVQNNRIEVNGFVIMPNHIHLLWKNNIEDENKFKMLTQGSLLKFTGKKIVMMMEEKEKEKFRVDAKDRTFQIWERNPLWVECITIEMAEQKLNYIHNNPCTGRWQLVNHPAEYKYSSAAFYETGIDNFGLLTSLYL